MTPLIAFAAVLLAAGSQPAAAPTRPDPRAVIVQVTDMPVPFAGKSGKYQGTSEYVAAYIRPEVLMATDLPSGGLFGVMASVAVSADAAGAQESFVARGGLSAESIRAEIAPRSSSPSTIRIEEITPAAAGLDHVVGFRVAYELEGQRTLEYRYRLLKGPIVANLIVAARATPSGGEPADLAGQAAAVLRKQGERILTALGPKA